MGLPYELIKKTTRPEDLQSAEYLRLNPNARIPTLVDGSVVIWESMAINLYLAQKYDGNSLARSAIVSERRLKVESQGRSSGCIWSRSPKPVR